MESRERAVISISFILILFIFFSYLVQKNLSFFMNIVSGHDYLFILIYTLLVILAVVLAPISAFPLLTMASNIFGWFYAALYSITGWFIGSVIAFSIARKYGKPVVKKLINIKNIGRIEKVIPKTNVFFSLIFLRMVLPVDVLSYALGLFTDIKNKTFMITTLIGISPLAFVLSYFGTVPLTYQVISLVLGISILLICWNAAIKKI